MNSFLYKNLPKLPKLKLAVVGHVEWMSFLFVDKLPTSGIISHAENYLEEPAGGGAVSAIQMAKLIKAPVHLITSLGKDLTGEKCLDKLEQMGLKLSVAWRDQPTRKGISLVDSNGERAITVIGERLQPTSKDSLPWDELNEYDGVFITATDQLGMRHARQAKVLTATPRVGNSTLIESKIKLDALIGSALDPDEKIDINLLEQKPTLTISTEGALGGEVIPYGRFKSCKPSSLSIDSYGCGDSFAGGVTTALSANWDIEKAISLGAYCGAECSTHFGPY